MDGNSDHSSKVNVCVSKGNFLKSKVAALNFAVSLNLVSIIPLLNISTQSIACVRISGLDFLLKIEALPIVCHPFYIEKVSDVI